MWRDKDKGNVILNISTPGQGEAAQENIIQLDGTEVPYQRARMPDFDPRKRDWFKNAMAADGTVWSEPYLFVDNVVGITASRAWRPTDSAAPGGVFTVDFLS